MDRITTRATEELRGLDGVRSADAHVGRAIRGDAVGGANTGEIWVSLDPDGDYDGTISSIEEVINGYPGLERRVLTYSQNQISDVLANETTPVRVRVYGQELDVLQEKAGEIGTILAGIDGAEDVRVQPMITEPTIEIEVDLDAAQEAGIKPGDVRRSATTLVSGIQVGALFEEQKIFEVQVWGIPEVRRSVTDVENLLLDVPGGGHIRLGEVADVRVGSSPASIDHDATSRSLDVTAAVSGRGREAVVDDLEEQMSAVSFPMEYHAEVLGDYVDRTGAERKLMFFALGSAIGIFLLLQAAFSSWRLAVVGFLGLLAAVSGGMVAAWFDGGTLTLAGVAGLLGVLAVALRQVLMLIGRLQHLDAGAGTRTLSLVSGGADERVGAVVTTAGVTALALLPMVFLGSIAGQEIVKPMAVVVIGGLVTTLLTVLLVLPAVYLHFAPPPGLDEVALAGQEPSEASAGPDDRRPVGVSAFSGSVPPIAPSTEG
jgi:Cu/Ag efflux pump CusA